MNENLLKKLTALQLPEPIYVVGMGISGKVALDLLREASYQALGFDEKLQARHVINGSLDNPEALKGAGTLVISPGIDRRRAAFQNNFALQINDVEIFARLNDKPVLAVTGSNGKSTVVSMLHDAILKTGKNSVLAGNIGYSILEALFENEQADYFVLELSSYQLELCPSLHPKVAALLNVTPDHLDRYNNFDDYAQAKANLLIQSSISIVNSDDAVSLNLAPQAQNVIFYGENFSSASFSNGELKIKQEKILDSKELQLKGKHNESNTLCVLLMLHEINLLNEDSLQAIKSFAALTHRLQNRGEINGVIYLDDSKATNVGATIAALAGLSEPLHLILGGQGKNQDFSELAQEIKKHQIKQVLLIGVDNNDLISALHAENIPFTNCVEMSKAVALAKEKALPGEIVLLSPACASLDQYRNYHERGECFAYEVNIHC